MGGRITYEMSTSCNALCVARQAGVFLEPGTVTEAILHAGDAGFAPRGSGHYFINTADEDAYVILIFDDGEFTNVDVTSLVADVPPQACAHTL